MSKKEKKTKVEKWLRAAAIRCIKTMAQSAIAMIPAQITIAQVDWYTVAGTAAIAGVLSLLTSLTGLPEVNTDEDHK